jgi:predicted dehydrogenase
VQRRRDRVARRRARKGDGGAVRDRESVWAYEDLLDDPDVDAVYVPLPNHLHAKWTMAAAEAGKHVLCEKPIAMNVAEAQAMLDACSSSGVRLMEAFMYRLHPSWGAVRELVHRGGSARSAPCSAGSRASTTTRRTSATSPSSGVAR